ncbi:hypothetical protein K456DRAFT_1777851, partial [Colletotrichum gloeosporioides 23]
YEPLTPGSIRLLVLQPSASHDAQLRGSLLCTTLAEADYDLIDPYTALSYVWGSDERPCLIFFDGKEFAITQSLNDALRNMRDATRARRIWADALCINQDDGPERNEQVRLMGKIYGLASSTIIYLGKLTEDAAEVLAATTLRATEADHTYETDDEDTRDAPAAEVHTKHVLIEAASRDLLSRLCFQRVWVLQELVLSKSPWIQCGQQRVRWEEFCRLLLRKPTNLPDEYRILLRVLEDMHETRNARAGGVGKPLYDVLKTRRGFGAADPRDRVYANLGIINDLRRVRKYLNVDYGESVQTVFTKVAAYIICTKGATYLMTQIQDMHFKEYLQGLPSWVPQWQYPVSRIIVTRNPESSDELCGTYQVLDIDGIPSILVHTGLHVDMVRTVSAVFPGNRDAARALIATEDYCHVREELLQLY